MSDSDLVAAFLAKRGATKVANGVSAADLVKVTDFNDVKVLFFADVVAKNMPSFSDEDVPVDGSVFSFFSKDAKVKMAKVLNIPFVKKELFDKMVKRADDIKRLNKSAQVVVSRTVDGFDDDKVDNKSGQWS